MHTYIHTVSTHLSSSAGKASTATWYVSQKHTYTHTYIPYMQHTVSTHLSSSAGKATSSTLYVGQKPVVSTVTPHSIPRLISLLDIHWRTRQRRWCEAWQRRWCDAQIGIGVRNDYIIRCMHTCVMGSCVIVSKQAYSQRCLKLRYSNCILVCNQLGCYCDSHN